MSPVTKARIVAAIACPLLLSNIGHAHATSRSNRTATAAQPLSEQRLDHISVVAIGKGSPVVLIPGLSSPRTVWDGVSTQLATSHRVILVQINGFAGDDPGANLKPGILAGVVADLDNYLTRNKLGSAAVVGHSLGGLVGLMLAKAHPADVGKLMIIDSLPFYGALFGPTATPAAIEPQAAAMRDKLAAGYGKPADAAEAEQVAEGLSLKPDSRAKVKAWVSAADPRVSAEAMYEDLQTDLRPDIATIGTPIMILYPWNDLRPTKLTADMLYKTAYASAPHVSYVDIGDAAHFVMLDQPEAFATALTAFLAS